MLIISHHQHSHHHQHHHHRQQHHYLHPYDHKCNNSHRDSVATILDLRPNKSFRLSIFTTGERQAGPTRLIRSPLPLLCSEALPFPGKFASPFLSSLSSKSSLILFRVARNLEPSSSLSANCRRDR